VTLCCPIEGSPIRLDVKFKVSRMGHWYFLERKKFRSGNIINSEFDIDMFPKTNSAIIIRSSTVSHSPYACTRTSKHSNTLLYPILHHRQSAYPTENTAELPMEISNERLGEIQSIVTYTSFTASMTAYSHTVPILSHSSRILSSSHHHLSPCTYAPHISFHSILPTTLFNSCLVCSAASSPPPLLPLLMLAFADDELDLVTAARNRTLTIVLPSALNPASASQTGKSRLGFRHRNCFSRYKVK